MEIERISEGRYQLGEGSGLPTCVYLRAVWRAKKVGESDTHVISDGALVCFAFRWKCGPPYELINEFSGKSAWTGFFPSVPNTCRQLLSSVQPAAVFTGIVGFGNLFGLRAYLQNLVSCCRATCTICISLYLWKKVYLKCMLVY